jgi:hypothetical protein
MSPQIDLSGKSRLEVDDWFFGDQAAIKAASLAKQGEPPERVEAARAWRPSEHVQLMEAAKAADLDGKSSVEKDEFYYAWMANRKALQLIARQASAEEVAAARAWRPRPHVRRMAAAEAEAAAAAAAGASPGAAAAAVTVVGGCGVGAGGCGGPDGAGPADAGPLGGGGGGGGATTEAALSGGLGGPDGVSEH